MSDFIKYKDLALPCDAGHSVPVASRCLLHQPIAQAVIKALEAERRKKDAQARFFVLNGFAHHKVPDIVYDSINLVD